jgi:hypothetical protein
MGTSITQHLHGKWTTPTWPGIILSALGGFKKIRPPHARTVTRSCRRILSARRPCWWEDSVDTSILSLIRVQHVVYDTENDFTYNPFTYIEVTQYRRNDHARMTGTRRISQPCHVTSRKSHPGCRRSGRSAFQSHAPGQAWSLDTCARVSTRALPTPTTSTPSSNNSPIQYSKAPTRSSRAP